ncbi:MAG: hypothetical protein V1806_04915 [Pseudomonadota bacterium]
MPELQHLACICCPATVSGPPEALEPWIALEDAPGRGICEACYTALAFRAITRCIVDFLAGQAQRGR